MTKKAIPLALFALTSFQVVLKFCFDLSEAWLGRRKETGGDPTLPCFGENYILATVSPSQRVLWINGLVPFKVKDAG